MAAGITTCRVLGQLAASGTLHTDCGPALQLPLLFSRPRARCLHFCSQQCAGHPTAPQPTCCMDLSTLTFSLRMSSASSEACEVDVHRCQ